MGCPSRIRAWRSGWRGFTIVARYDGHYSGAFTFVEMQLHLYLSFSSPNSTAHDSLSMLTLDMIRRSVGSNLISTHGRKAQTLMAAPRPASNDHHKSNPRS
ncbi:hypothetical protein KCU74_g121, partial [Aureobasidium melanogenum]